MSDLARLAAAIAKSSDSELSAQVSRYLDSTVTPCNHYALATQLLSKRALEARIRPLTAVELEKLASGASSPSLRAAWLADESAAYFSARELATELRGRHSSISGAEETRELNPYDSVRCFTELCYLVRKNWTRRSAAGMRAADLRLVSQRLGISDSLARACFALLVSGGQVMAQGESWQVSQVGERWLSLDFPARWIAMAKTALSSGKVLDFNTLLEPGANLSSFIRDSFPLISSDGELFIRNMAAVGLLSAGRVTELFPLLQRLEQNSAQLIEAVTKTMPRDEPRVIVQSDLTIVATGPLTADLWGQLEEFSDPQELGLVSRFAMNLASVTNGLQVGWTADSIGEFLAAKSAREVPQPVWFLLRDAQRRFGDLEVLAVGQATAVTSPDSILLTQIQNQPELAPLRLKRASDNRLESSFGGREVALALRASGYPALMPQQAATTSTSAQQAAEDWVEQWVRAIRATSTEGDSKEQLLQLALRSAVPLCITYNGPGGASTVTVRVLGMTEQRIRCRELGAEAELTLPQSSITQIALGAS